MEMPNFAFSTFSAADILNIDVRETMHPQIFIVGISNYHECMINICILIFKSAFGTFIRVLVA